MRAALWLFVAIRDARALWYATALVSPAKQTAFVLVTNKGDETVEDALLPMLGHVAQLR